VLGNVAYLGSAIVFAVLGFIALRKARIQQAEFARLLGKVMRADGRNVLSNIFRAMIRCGIERDSLARKEKRIRSRRYDDDVMVGSLNQLERMFEPNKSEFAKDLDGRDLGNDATPQVF
jgi:hypothetical protein